MSQSLLEMTKDLILAQIQAQQLSPEERQIALQQIHTSLLALKAQEDTAESTPGETPEVPPEPVHWRKSITKYHVICLECGQSCKQLSVRHLREHRLDGKTYRIKYGIPRTQALAAKETTAKRKEIMQRSKLWEKAPTYVKMQEEKKKQEEATGVQRKRTGRAKV